MINYKRRHTVAVKIKDLMMGSDYGVRVQSMTSTNTNDIDASVEQCKRIANAGAHLVRLTAQGVREAESIGAIREKLIADGCEVPLVADIHFNPKAAFAAAKTTDKVRINPGNFVDVARTFKKLSFTDEEYAQEIKKIRDTLVPFINLCKEHGTAVRLGVNHGSLSDRIMSRYGDTPAGMVESVMEFLRVMVDEDFTNVVISIKASNTVVMVETVRRLVVAMDAEDMHFPLHLGVTEAGDGEDGRIKSAVGIGTLLAEGVGDTIRVSLSEDPELEVPVAQKLVNYITSREGHEPIDGQIYESYDRLQPLRRHSNAVAQLVGGKCAPVTVAACSPADVKGKMKPDFYFAAEGVDAADGNRYIVPADKYQALEGTYPLFDVAQLGQVAQCNAELCWVSVSADVDLTALEPLRDFNNVVLVVDAANVNVPGSIQALLHKMMSAGIEVPVVARCAYDDTDKEWLQVKSGADLGALLLNGFRDGIWLEAPNYADADDVVRCQYGILQAARLRMSKTEFISCPGCGRTLFDLQSTVQQVKAATEHLSHLKIGIMGCIVNGPGEMADADYGYVGAAPGKISLYKNKDCIEKNIPQEEAIPRLIALIKENGDWVDPE